MGRSKVLSIALSVIGAVVLSFFVFAFVDYKASSPGSGTPVSDQEKQTEENKSDETKNKEQSQKDNKNKQNQDTEANHDTNISNNVQNNVNAEKANVDNNVQNNVNGDNSNADVNNSINNNLNNSNNNEIQNNVSNNINVNVNVNVTNNINNNANAQDEKKNSNKENDGNTSSDEKDNNDGKQPEEGENNQEKTLWGVDSASQTNQQLLACVKNNFGSPEIWGRYLGDKEGVSAGLTQAEAELLHSNDIKILVIWNHFTNATGYENGKAEANEAIQMARSFGIPEGVALFADIEPGYPVDSEFIRGWFEVMNQSEYKAGIYGVFDKDALYYAFDQAAQNNKELLQNTYIWTAHPNAGITTEANTPAYKPAAPENALVGGWQYGLDAQTCNIDTNLFNSDILDVVW